MKRSLPSMRLRRSPLVHVLAQVRFPEATSFIGESERLREIFAALGFPRPNRGTIQNIRLDVGSAPQIEQIERWSYFDLKKRNSVFLTPEFVSLHTNDYLTFEPFLDRFADVLNAVSDALDITVIERVGLRYIDLVELREGENFEQYLEPRLLGFPFEQIRELEFESSTFESASVASTAAGFLAIRCSQLPENHILPPDISRSDLDYGSFLRSGAAAALDFDHYSTEPQEFSVDSLIEQFWALHDGIDHAFRTAVTSYALERWERE